MARGASSTRGTVVGGSLERGSSLWALCTLCGFVGVDLGTDLVWMSGQRSGLSPGGLKTITGNTISPDLGEFSLQTALEVGGDADAFHGPKHGGARAAGSAAHVICKLTGNIELCHR